MARVLHQRLLSGEQVTGLWASLPFSSLSCFQHLLQTSLLSTDLDHISLHLTGKLLFLLHRKQTSSDQSYLHFLPLSRACTLCPPVWVEGGCSTAHTPSQRRRLHQALLMPETSASSLQPLLFSCLLPWHSHKHRSLLTGKPPSKFPLSHLPKKLELAFSSQPNHLTPPPPTHLMQWSDHPHRPLVKPIHPILSPLGPGLHPHQAPHAALTQGPGTSGSLKPVVNFPSLSQLASQLHQILVTPTPTLTPNAHFKTLFPFSVPETSVLPSKITNKLTAPQCPHCIWTHMGYCSPGVSFSVFHRHPSANTPKTVLMSPLCRAPSP